MSRKKRNSIEVATRSFDSERENKENGRVANPRLGPTRAVIGKWECPDFLKGNQPDMAMVIQTRELLGYKTNVTVLEWWALFPSRRWWSYAITATRYLAKSRNYKYFLRCLVTAAKEGARFKMFSGWLKQVTGQVADEESEKERPVMVRPHGNRCTCETCSQVILNYHKDHEVWLTRRWDSNAYRAAGTVT